MLCDWNAQERLEALSDPSVVHLRESERQRRMDNPEHVICSGSGAQQEQEPSTLEIGDFGDSVQKNSMFVNLLIKLALHEVFVPQWSAENGDALLVSGKIVVTAPYTTWLTMCIEEKVLAIRWCLPGPVPHLSFALIDRDPGVPPELILQRLLDSGNSGWDRSDVHVIQEGEESLTGLALPPVLGVARVRRGQASMDHLVPLPRPAESPGPLPLRLPTNV